MRIVSDRRNLAIAAAVLVAALFTPPAAADPNKTCALDGVSIVAFGVYDPTSDSPLDVQGRVAYRCFNGSNKPASQGVGSPSPGQLKNAINVQISLGTGVAGSYSRYMLGGRDRLRYNVYLDAQHTQIWGDGTGGTQVYASGAQPNNKVVIVPVFGRVFPGQDVSADFYLDQIIVTLDF
jgi:spore coat protein U-like protein